MGTPHYPRTHRIAPPLTFLALSPTTSLPSSSPPQPQHSFLSLSPTTSPSYSPFKPSPTPYISPAAAALATAAGLVPLLDTTSSSGPVSALPVSSLPVAVLPVGVAPEHRRSSSVTSVGGLNGGRFLRLGHVGGEEGDWSAVVE